jgi:hypothetical protein
MRGYNVVDDEDRATKARHVMLPCSTTEMWDYDLVDAEVAGEDY